MKSIWFYKFSPKNSEQVFSRPSKQKSSRERKTIISLTTVSRKKLMKKKIKTCAYHTYFCICTLNLIKTQTISMGNIKYMVLNTIILPFLKRKYSFLREQKIIT